MADTVTVSGDLTAGDPVADLPNSNCGFISISGAHYDSYTFEVAETGTYTLETTLVSHNDTVLMLYSPSFVPPDGTINCIAANDDGGVGFASKITITLNKDTPYVAVVRGFGNQLGTYSLSISGDGDVCLGACEGVPIAFEDGRLNRFDAAAPIVIYPVTINNEVGMNIYAVTNDSRGDFLFQVTPAEIAAVPSNPDVNTPIKVSNNVQVWRLSSGEFQIVTPTTNGSGKVYNIIFDEITDYVQYTSFEQ